MTSRFLRGLSSLVEFLGRFWPLGKSEDTVLHELRDQYPTDEQEPGDAEPQE